jgi:hypothetical protein
MALRWQLTKISCEGEMILSFTQIEVHPRMPLVPISLGHHEVLMEQKRSAAERKQLQALERRALNVD